MARGVNTVHLIGGIGAAPEVKVTQGGLTITTVRLATDTVRKGHDGQQVVKTQWHRVKFFGRLGDLAADLIDKGKMVYVTGSIDYDQYTKPDGSKVYTTEIHASGFELLGGREQGSSHAGSSRSGPNDEHEADHAYGQPQYQGAAALGPDFGDENF